MAKNSNAKDPLKAREQKQAQKRHKKKVSILRERRNRFLLIGVATFAVVVLGAWLFVQFQPESVTEEQREGEQFTSADQLYADERYAEAAEQFEQLAKDQVGETKQHTLVRAAESWGRAEDIDNALRVFKAAIAIPGVNALSTLEAYSLASAFAFDSERYDEAETFLNGELELLNNLPEEAEVENRDELIASVEERLEAVRFSQEQSALERYNQLSEEYQELALEEGQETISVDEFKALKEKIEEIIAFAEDHELPAYTDDQIINYRNELRIMNEAGEIPEEQPAQ